MGFHDVVHNDGRYYYQNYAFTTFNIYPEMGIYREARVFAYKKDLHESYSKMHKNNYYKYNVEEATARLVVAYFPLNNTNGTDFLVDIVGRDYDFDYSASYGLAQRLYTSSTVNDGKIMQPNY